MKLSLWTLAVLAPLTLVLPTAARADDVADNDAAVDATPVAVAAKTPEFSQGILFPHSILDRALARAIDKNGTVDYVALKGDKDLAQYIQATATADLSLFPTWEIEAGTKDKNAKPKIDRSAELVFWINAYNAHVLKTLSDAYPLDSPDEIKDFDTAKTHRVAGKDYSFAEMREKIIAFDPRALFALTDGTLGGPMLALTAYRFRDIDLTLNSAANTFVNDDRNVSVERIANKVTISDYFSAANAPFTPLGERRKMAGVRLLLSAYTDKRGQRAYFTANDYQIILKPRDRKLNIKTK